MILLKLFAAYKELVTFDEIYVEFMVALSVLVLRLNGRDFATAELILYNKLVEENIWSALLATDVWKLIVKYYYNFYCLTLNQLKI